MSTRPSLRPPLAQAWIRSLSGNPELMAAPVVRGGEVLVRARGSVAALGADTGEVRWQTAIEPDDQLGVRLITTDDAVLADVGSMGGTAVVCLDGRGRERWRESFDGLSVAAVASMDGRRVTWLTLTQDGRTWLHDLDVRTGDMDEAEVPGGSEAAVVTREGLWLATPAVHGARPGLYRYAKGRLTRVLEDGVAGIAANETRVFCALQPGRRHAYEVVAVDGESVAWRQPLGRLLDADGDHLLSARGEDRHTATMMLVDVRTGERLWTGPRAPRQAFATALATDCGVLIDMAEIAVADRKTGAEVQCLEVPEGLLLRYASRWGVGDGLLVAATGREVVAWRGA